MDPHTSDKELLDILVKVCHNIAHETESDALSLAPGEEIIDKLFALTDHTTVSPTIAGLAESFGLMLVKLEARDLRQSQLIDKLRKTNHELEITREKLGEEKQSLVVSLREKYSPDNFVAISPLMQRVTDMALNIARHPINTLILGASGTGKEVFAKMIHFNSLRADRPFLAVNCTAIPESLFESEVFGIEKGVATGVSRRKGLFEQAHTGTLFLDEIGDMGLAGQAKLLRVLEEREVVRVGGVSPIKIDVKVISATNSDLKLAVEQGKFRDDLYYRLNVVELKLPSLKERGEDIIILAEKFLKKHCRDMGRSPLALSRNVRQCLLAYGWPGNVRELNNEMERAAALTFSHRVEVRDLSSRLRSLVSPLESGDQSINLSEAPPEPYPGDLNESSPGIKSRDLPGSPPDFNIENMEKMLVYRALEETGNNRTKAAALLGITREGLRKKLLRFEKHRTHGGMSITPKHLVT
ncbi:MAG: sigma 54-interacting transcriptional regulator [Desulfamplus sp.]|nr:sigma 54-interacting transcriptional regulator [Desulfamplus sp.]